jgi:pyruvate kinase
LRLLKVFIDSITGISNLRGCKGVHWTSKHNFNLRAVLLDTKGPEIRTGKIKDGNKVLLEAGKELILTTDEEFKTSGTAEKIYITYKALCRTVKPGDVVLLSDGLIRLTVLDVGFNEVRCLINNTEQIGNKKGVNLPGLIVDLPALSSKDKEDLEFGVQNDVDFIAASFIRKPDDVVQIRQFVESKMILA